MTILTDPFPALDQLPSVDASLLAGTEPLAQRQAREQARHDGRAEGLERGYRDGLEAAAIDASRDVSFALTALHGAIEDLAARDAAGLEQLGREAIELAVAIAEEILGRELSESSQPVMDALHRAVRFAPDRGAARARVHPDDLAAITDLAPGEFGREVEFVADRSIERGGCVLEVGAARIDAQVTPALGRVRDALLASSLAEDPADDPAGDPAAGAHVEDIAAVAGHTLPDAGTIWGGPIG